MSFGNWACRTRTCRKASSSTHLAYRNDQSCRARSHQDTPPEAWLYIPVPPLVDAAVLALVQEQLEENRRHARQSLRGARHLLQGFSDIGLG
jgi:hypothetical protein